MKQNISIQNKKSFYFSHDSNARNDEKIIRLRMDYGAQGYGLYFMVVEMLMESSDYKLYTDYLALAFHLHSEGEVLQAVIENYGLFEFTADHAFFYSVSLMQRMKPLEQLREKCRQAGIKSGEARRAKALSKVSATDLELVKDVVSPKLEDEKSLPTKVKHIRFVPPSAHELEVYCSEAKLNVGVESFLDYYESKGWLVGKNKMKDWKAAVRNWHRRGLDGLGLGFKAVSTASLTDFRNDKVYEKF